MKKLLKAYGLNSDMQYFERIALLFTKNDKKAAKGFDEYCILTKSSILRLETVY